MRFVKRTFIGLFVVIFTFISISALPDESHASLGSIRDGNATGSNYSPTDVDPTIKRAWERWNANDRKMFIKGGKASSYTPSNGRRLTYDVYNGSWKISNNEFIFEGWAVNLGYRNHDRYNQATYIGAVQVQGNKEVERKIFKAEMLLNTHAATKAKGKNSDIYYDNGSKTRWCRDNEYRKEQQACNMEYKHVGFRAHIPLKELFPSTKENRTWKLYIIKNINGRLVYDQLVLPFNINSRTWNKGTLTLKSEVKNKKGHSLIALGSKTRKRIRPESRDVDPRFSKYFRQGNSYKINRTRLLTDSVTPFYGLIVPEDGNVERWTTSAYMRANGEIATLSYRRTVFDVTVKHVDKNSGETLLNEGKKEYSRGTYTFSPKGKGTFKTPEGYSYVPLDKSKRVTVNKDMTITFNYKASIPNPSRTVEQGGGQKTHGHAVGQAEWKLYKGDKPDELPDPNEKDFEYRTVSGGVEIINYVGTNKNVNIPKQIKGQNVVSIAGNAFAGKGISNVNIPDTVVRIGKGAFKLNNLTTINIPDGVGRIEDEAFMSNQITEIMLPNGIESVGTRAFFGNAITTLEVGESLERIGELAFANNQIGELDFGFTNLKYIESSAFLNNEISTVVFNNGLIRIGEYAFTGNALKEVNLPESVGEVGAFAFADNAIENIIIYNEFIMFGEGVLAYNQENPKDLVVFGYIPSSAKKYADANNHSFRDLYEDFVYVEVDDGVKIVAYNGEDTELTIPRRLGGKNVVSIGESAFEEKALKSVVLPPTVHTIEELAFAYNELTSIDLSNVIYIKSSAFVENELNNVVFSSNLREIGAFAFKDNKLTKVSIPDDVSVIGQSAFEENELTTVNLGSGVTEIQEYAFGNNKITKVNLPNRLRIIGDSAFRNNQLTEIKIPNSLEIIGESAFENNNLKEVEIRRNIEINGFAFADNTEEANDFTIYGYCGSTAFQYAMEYGNHFVDINGKQCDIYVLATDDDFEFEEDNGEGTFVKDGVRGYFRYVGSANYVEIPHEIQGVDVTSYYRMFEHSHVEGVKSTNKNVTNMWGMFKDSQADELDVSQLETSSVTNMGSMFSGSYAIKIYGLENFETSNVTNMENMFADTQVNELDLSSFDMSNVESMNDMLKNTRANKGYARTQEDLDKLNNVAVTNKPAHLTFVLNNAEISLSDSVPQEEIKFVDTRSVWQKVFDFFTKPMKVNADTELKESMTQLVNNFIVTGNHAGVRNVKYTLKAGNTTETNSKPFAVLVDPQQTKNKDMEYDLEYEYTNHVKLTYKCTDKLGSDCFAWKLDKSEPAWDKAYVKKFKLSDTVGQFERYSTSRLGRINNANALVYSSLNDNVGKKAGNDLVGRTFYIKEKAIKGDEVRYLISTRASRTEGIVGWVNELDMTTYTHYRMDSKTKTFELTGEGKAYQMAWGGSKQEAGINLSKQKGKNFVVNATETVGDNIWYRGKINNQGSNIWIHKNHTTSNEIIKINATDEVKLNNVNNSNAKLTLKMDHKHGDDIVFTKNSGNEIELLVGRSAKIENGNVTTNAYHETIEVDRSDTKLEAQTWKEVKHTFKYDSDYKNRFFVIEGDKYYYPYDLDENLRDKYRNKTKHSYGKYAIPLRVSDEKQNALEFKTQDNFLITKKTGFQFSLPYHEVSTLVIREEAKQQYEEFTGKEYDDAVISDPFDASRYYLNIALDAEQKPNTKYSDNVVLGKLGLSDVTVHLMQELEFENYLAGHYKDDPALVEQKTSVKRGIDYTNELVFTSSEMAKLKQIQKERDGVIHSFRKTDDAEIIEKVREVTP